MTIRIAIIIFLISILAGPLYTVSNYNQVTNTISELGAQNTPHNYIMIIGFVVIGTAIALQSIYNWSLPIAPFFLFGLFIALAGMFPHKPINNEVPFNTLIHSAHSILATISGISLTVGFIWQGVLIRNMRVRFLLFFLAVVCVVFPVLMVLYPGCQGVTQRLMYFQIFTWFWLYFPNIIMANK